MSRALSVVRSVAVLFALLLGAAPARAQTPAATFEQRCATCHGSPSNERAPTPSLLRLMPPERIYRTLTSGAMQAQAEGLTDAQRRAIAEYLSERRIVATESASAAAMSNRCTSRQPLVMSAPSWNGWGGDAVNSRSQSTQAAGLSPEQASRLRLKWAFGVPGATSVYAQPTVVGDWLYVASDTGYVYALSAATGCVQWSFQAQAGVRTAITVAPAPGRPGRFNAYFGDMRATVYAVDAESGDARWMMRVEEHALARITGAPVLHEDTLYVPVSSFEEGSAGSLAYQCCTFRGSLVAMEAATGRPIWKTYTIAAEPKPTKKNSRGVQQWGPAGGAIWSSPTIDARRGLVYIVSGNSYTAPAPKTTDALMALDLKTGAIRWSAQATEDDSWIGGCGPTPVQQAAQAAGTPPATKSENCPDDLGPDYDFAASPMLVRVGTRDMLITGQKSGMIAARDPEKRGAAIWQLNAANRAIGPQGEIVWGGAHDTTNAYFGLNGGAVIAVRLSGGSQAWRRPFQSVDPQRTGNNSAITVAGGVVLIGGWDGAVHALRATTGEELWTFNTQRDFETVNGVMAHGGSIGGPGPVVVGGTVFVNSGYIGVQRGAAGNVLLAFTAE